MGICARYTLYEYTILKVRVKLNPINVTGTAAGFYTRHERVKCHK